MAIEGKAQGPFLLKDVSIVVLSHNRLDALKSSLPGLCEIAATQRIELIVVDNASTDGSVDYLKGIESDRGPILVIFSPSNLGVSGGRNLGWRSSSRDLILNVDDDTRLTLASILELVNFMRDNKEVGVAFPRVRQYPTLRDQTPYGKFLSEPANFHGACHIVRQLAYDQVGEIDPACSFGGEELDYSIRMRAKNWHVVFVPVIEVLHESIVRVDAASRWRRTQWLYNYVRVVNKHFPPRHALVYTFRLFLIHVISGSRACGPSFVLAASKAAWAALVSGRRSYRPLPRDVVDAYLQDNFLPEFGNIPLYRKVAAKLSRI